MKQKIHTRIAGNVPFPVSPVFQLRNRSQRTLQAPGRYYSRILATALEFSSAAANSPRFTVIPVTSLSRRSTADPAEHHHHHHRERGATAGAAIARGVTREHGDCLTVKYIAGASIPKLPRTDNSTRSRAPLLSYRVPSAGWFAASQPELQLCCS